VSGEQLRGFTRRRRQALLTPTRKEMTALIVVQAAVWSSLPNRLDIGT
jgi:hypothetical protein